MVEAQRLAKEKADLAEAERLAKEKAAAEAERLRLAKEKADLAEAERLAKEKAAAEEERLRVANEKAAEEERQRIAMEAAAAEEEPDDQFGVEAEPDDESDIEPNNSEEDLIFHDTIEQPVIIGTIVSEILQLIGHLNQIVQDLKKNPKHTRYDSKKQLSASQVIADNLTTYIDSNLNEIRKWQNDGYPGYSIINIQKVLANLFDRIFARRKRDVFTHLSENDFKDKIEDGLRILIALHSYFSSGDYDTLIGYDKYIKKHPITKRTTSYSYLTDEEVVVKGGKSTRKISRKSSHNLRHTKRVMRRKRSTNTHNKRPTFRRNQTRRK